MLRRIIEIDQEKCNGCGACANACHEGAIGMVNGKATLLRDDYCDGLGDCLPSCPVDAISFVEREALPYDEEAVLENMKKKGKTGGCPGSAQREIVHETTDEIIKAPSQLRQWPVQIKLLPLQAPFYQGAHLLIAADCTAYAYGNFHEDFIKDKVTLIGCPKLDSTDYSDKLSEIFKNNEIEKVSVARMQVPCCGGIEMMVKKAIEKSGKDLDLEVITISPNGEIVSRV